MRSSRPVQILALVGALGMVSACAAQAPDTETVEAPADTGTAEESAEPSGAPTEESAPPEEATSDPAPEESGDETGGASGTDPGPGTDDPSGTGGVSGDVDLGNRTGPGSFDSPLSPGDPIELSSWTIENLEVTEDNTDQFREEMGDLAPRPRSGYVYLRVRADFTLTSDRTDIVGSPGFDLTMDLIGGSGELYDDHSNCPNFIDNDWGMPELSMGDSATADVCLHVPEDDLDGAKLMIGTLWRDDEPLFVAID